MLTDLWFRWRGLFRRGTVESELDDELRFHVERQIEKYMGLGMTSEEAQRRTRLDFGGLEQIKEECRGARGLHFIESLWYDFRFAWRMLLRNPSLTAVALLTLALGIGANSAIFSVINAVLLRPLPYPHSDRLVYLSEWTPQIRFMYVSMPDFQDWLTRNTVFEAIGGYRSADTTLTGVGEVRHLKLRQVTPGLFSTLSAKPVLGRLLTVKDDKPESPSAIVLSQDFWTREFNRDPRVIGQRFDLDGEAHTVVGVVDNSHWHLGWPEVEAFTSLGRLTQTPPFVHRDDHHGVYVLARLKPGVTFEAAREQMWTIARQLAQQYPQTNSGATVNMSPLLAGLVENVRRPLLLLMAAVVLVLLIACVNVANLLTSLAIVRRQEIAIRCALGAGAARLARQFLCESILLAFIGGAAGLLLAHFSIGTANSALAHLASSTIPRLNEISIDKPVLFFTLGISLLTGIAFGVVPALAALRIDPHQTLMDSGRISTSGLSRAGVRGVLVAAELALSLVLLLTTGLTIKSFVMVIHQDRGFRADGVLTASLSLPAVTYPDDTKRRLLVQQLVEKTAALPSVRTAGFKFPLLAAAESRFLVEGRHHPEPDDLPYTEFSTVSPGGLEAMGIQLRSGRYFKADDQVGSEPVCIIDDLLANEYWPNQNAIGKRIAVEAPVAPNGFGPWRTIVGVVHHVQHYAGDWPTLAGTYLPYSQYPFNGGTLVVRSDADQVSLEPMLRDVLQSLDPTLAFYNVRPFTALVDEDVAGRRLVVILLGALAGVALLLAMIGSYGVMAYMVTGRTHEIGLRRALGAEPRDVLRLILAQGLRLTITGTAIGVAAALALTRLIRSLLFGVSATDPLTFAGVVVFLMIVAMAACYIPARKAVGLNPLDALRHE